MPHRAAVCDGKKPIWGWYAGPALASIRIRHGSAWWPIALLFVAAVPFAATFVTHHPDERHHRDAALNMLASGDWLTPRTFEAPLELRKPIITHWMAAVGYAVLGPSPLSSRLPFLLAACATVGLTYFLALKITSCESTAVLSALFAACHPALFISATRSMPDMPLCLFLLISAYGFLSVIVHDRCRWPWLLAGYGGGGLAVATKGLPAAAFVFVAVAFIALYPGLKSARRWLAHAPWAVLGAAIGGAWFAGMYVLHGDELINAFFVDQVRTRLHRPSLAPLVQLPQYLLLLWCSFLPWLLPLWRVRSWRQLLLPNVPSAQRRGVQLILLWSAIYLLLASLVERVNLRYLLPLVPLLCVLVSSALHSIPAAAKFARSACSVLLTIPLLVFFAVSPVALPDLSQAIWQELARLEATEAPIVIVGKPTIASGVRLFSKGTADIHGTLELNDSLPSAASAVVLAEGQNISLDPALYRIHRFQHGFHDVSAPGVWSSLRRSQLDDYLEAHRQTIVIGIPLR